MFKHLGIDPDAATHYTNSKVVLGYLNSHTRRFYKYVTNRVASSIDVLLLYSGKRNLQMSVEGLAESDHFYSDLLIFKKKFLSCLSSLLNKTKTCVQK